MFQNRVVAGKDLALCLEEYKDDENALVIGLPRGGVIVAYEVAKALNLPLDVICPRKIGAPFNEEVAIGAITDTGEVIYNQDLIQRLNISKDYLEETSKKESEKSKKRMELFRKNRPTQNFKGKKVILVDDGLATGYTMKAAIKSVKMHQAEKVIVAVPVAPLDTVEEMDVYADDVICIDTPPLFQAVGQFYQDFSQVQDEEVNQILEKELFERSNR